MSSSGRQNPVVQSSGWKLQVKSVRKDSGGGVGGDERDAPFSFLFSPTFFSQSRESRAGNRGELPEHVSGWHQMRMSWHALPLSPFLPCLEHMARRRRHLAALTLSSCALSSPVGTLGTATSSTTCGSSRAQRGPMNYSGLQLQTWLLSRRYCTVNTHQTPCHTHAHIHIQIHKNPHMPVRNRRGEGNISAVGINPKICWDGYLTNSINL